MPIPEKKSPERLLTLPEVQSYLGIKSRKTILKYIKNNELPAYKLGGTRWRISLSGVKTFLKKHQIDHSQLKGLAAPAMVSR